MDKVLTQDIHLFQQSCGIKKKKKNHDNPTMQSLLHKVFVFQNKPLFLVNVCQNQYSKLKKKKKKKQRIIRSCITPLWAFPGGSDGKEFACHAGDPGSVPGLGRLPGEAHGNPLQYCLENPMGRGAWGATFHEVA